MENSTVDSTSEFKPISHENSSNNVSNWNDREHRHDHGKNRIGGRDNEWNCERNYHGKNRETIREEENRDRFRDDQLQQQQVTSFPAYGYAASDQSFADSSRRAVPMMNYNFMASWGVNHMDNIGMPQNNLAINATQPVITAGLEVNQNSCTSVNPYAYMGMSGDTSIFGMMGNYYPYGMINGQDNTMINPVKEILKFSKCTLIPPDPNAPLPRINQKPFGCKTSFVGNLPEKITDEIIKEIFEQFGEIDEIRMNEYRNKKFCHVQFKSETSVDKAISFSGYKIKVDNKDESGYTSHIHVDYAQSRKDLHTYECQQRALQREVRHRLRLESDCFQPPTPPPIVHYSDHEAAALTEKLRGKETFQEACLKFTRWLEHNECNKRNSGTFYSMIQSTNSHIRRLTTEKSKYEDELIKAKSMFNKQMKGILFQFDEICKVFKAAHAKKVWDHFTKPQRKNIELWKKQAEEIREAHAKEAFNDRVEDEMELSDDDWENENNAVKKIGISLEQNNSKEEEQVQKLVKENRDLRLQVQAVENEIEVIKRESKKSVNDKDKEIEDIKRESEKLINDKEKEIENLKLRFKRQREDSENESYSHKYGRYETEQHIGCQTDFDSVNFGLGPCASSSFTDIQSILEREARIIGVVSAFLQVHPFGANLDYICSYLHEIDSTIRRDDLVNLLQRYPTVFREDSTGIGASLEKVWKFLVLSKN